MNKVLKIYKAESLQCMEHEDWQESVRNWVNQSRCVRPVRETERVDDPPVVPILWNPAHYKELFRNVEQQTIIIAKWWTDIKALWMLNLAVFFKSAASEVCW